MAAPEAKSTLTSDADVRRSLHLVQLLIPLYNNAGQPFPSAEYAKVREELIAKFSGITMHSRAPCDGLWHPSNSSRTVKDDLIIYEVMTEQLDMQWWRQYRQELERRFEQDALVVRAMQMQML